jgi:hypothetical protein
MLTKNVNSVTTGDECMLFITVGAAAAAAAAAAVLVVVVAVVVTKDGQ